MFWMFFFPLYIQFCFAVVFFLRNTLRFMLTFCMYVYAYAHVYMRSCDVYSL